MAAETKTLHFDISHKHPQINYKLRAGLKEYPLTQHTDQTHSLAVQSKPGLNFVPRHRMSHFATDVVLPLDVPLLWQVTTPSKIPGAELDSLVLAGIHIPDPARRKVLERRLSSGRRRPVPTHLKFVAPDVSLDPGDIESHLHVHDWNSAVQAACTLTFMHGELCNLDPNTAAEVMEIIEYSVGLDDLATAILDQASDHEKDPSKPNWVIEDFWRDEKGNPIKGKPRYRYSERTCELLRSPLKDALRTTKNALELQSTTAKPGCWAPHYGVTEAAPRVLRPISRASIAGQPPTYNWTLINHTPQGGVSTDLPSFDGEKLSIAFKNYYLRYLGVYVEFRDEKGSIVKQNGNDKQYYALIDAVNTILGIPLPPVANSIDFKIPTGATTVVVYLGGLGRHEGVKDAEGKYYGEWNAPLCTLGLVMTVVFNIFVPTLCLAAGIGITALVATGSLTEIKGALQELVVLQLETLITLVTNLFTGPSGAEVGQQLAHLGTNLLLLAPGLLEKLAAGIAAAAAAQMIVNAIPFVGWIATGIGIASDVAELLETTIEVSQSPAVYQVEVKRTMTAKWVLSPDTGHRIWPEKATHYEALATYGKGGTPYKVEGKLPTAPSKEPLAVEFKDGLPAGEGVKVSFEVKLYAQSGAICGSASIADVAAKPTEGNTLVLPPTSITEKQVGLNSKTSYEFQRKVGFNAATGKHEYLTGTNAIPSATIKSLSTANDGRNLGRLVSLAFATEQDSTGKVVREDLAYAFQASGQDLPLLGESGTNRGQMYAIQKLGISDDPEATLGRLKGGFLAQSVVIANPVNASGNVGRGFLFIDPRGEKYHVRPLVAGADGRFDLGQKSLGRFNGAIDACAVSAGVAVGVNKQNSKIETLVLGPGQDDNDAPVADIHSGQGDRAGLVRNPIAVAALPTAGVVILSEGDRLDPTRSPPNLQAFDIRGNPVNAFQSKSSAYVALHPEANSVTYLDVVVEAMGYMYVLKYLAEGKEISDYIVDLYTPDGSYLTQFSGIAAAKLAVNYWRDLFTLNYELVAKPENLGTEPSVGVWLPSTPGV